MNNKGQLSIIAALLVAVILITTVIVTYSLVRDNPIEGQPSIQSALDETNLGIKQILGFTVGYYGSVLKVTGNSSYAKTLATGYLQSGLVQIANMHPEWASSLNIGNLNLYASWFSNSSYSGGDLSVAYNLTTLGILGMNYTTSCELSVNIANPANGQACLNVTQDIDQPLVSLGKQNLKFFTYQGSTWNLTSPSTDPTVYGNGTYQITTPAGIDVNSYVIQVQDQRGIIVVASSFSSYIMNLTWPSITPATLYAHQEKTNINGTNYYNLSTISADASGSTIDASMSSSRTLFAQTVFPLKNVSTIPASIWTMYYRAWKDAIALDNVASADTGSSSLSIFSWSHTTGSGSNRIMIVGISIRSSSVQVNSISYGSQSLTYIRSDTNSNGIRSELWNLTAPNSGTSTVTVTLSGSARATGGSCTYTGVNQTAPIDNSTGGSNSNASPSQSITVNTANSLLVGHVAIRGSSSSPYSVVSVSSEGSGQTQRWDEVTTSGSSSNARGHGSDKGPVGTGNQSMSWTLSGSAYWAVSVVALRPATLAAGHIDVDILIRQSTGAIRNVIATGAAASGDLTTAPSTLSGNYSWPTYSVTSQNDYLEFDYYVNVTTTGSTNAHLVIDNQTLAVVDQTRVAGLSLPSLKLGTVSDAITIELLENGTMRWLGQNLQLTTQTNPLPPVPTKAIHVSQTISNADSEVPFQIEDWASGYTVPLGLTSNASVFSDGNMLVFLVNNKVSRIKIWWNGTDTATQTPYAYTNRYFNDSVTTNTLTLRNGILTLNLTDPSAFTFTSTVGSSSCTVNFMRINQQSSVYGSDQPVYVITNGTVRDIIRQEPEWSGGVTGCQDFYGLIVLALPANATYFTYQLSLMFQNTNQTRSITDICPISLTGLTGQPQVENGITNESIPIVWNATGSFYNSSSIWQHHWSQFVQSTKGAGIMFTDNSNQRLYAFDGIAGTNTGALGVNSATIELLPATMASVSFNTSMNIAWYGAIATFSGTTPIYNNTDQTGLWMLVEDPPTIAANTGN